MGPGRARRFGHAQALAQVSEAGIPRGATGGAGLTLRLLAELTDKTFGDRKDGDALRLHRDDAPRAGGASGTARFGDSYPAALFTALEAEATAIVRSV